MTASRSATVGDWLTDLRTVALVGTARREPAEPPPELGMRPDSEALSREERLLHGAAVADVLRRAGSRPDPVAGALAPSPPESRAEVGPAAAQLLLLLLTQPPTSRATRDDLLVEWLGAAESTERRVPPALLPRLLTHAATRPEVAKALRGTLGERGRWLAAHHPDWSSLAGTTADEGPGPTGDEMVSSWQQLPTAEAVAAFGAARTADPDAARAMLESEWGASGARLRAECTRLLVFGLSERDEPLLERALDDRAKAVREAAWRALDRLPASARARRMDTRLRALLHVRGTLRRGLEVDVPDDPDAAGVRDGLVSDASGTVAPRTQWLATIVRGAPLATWTDVTGRGPGATLGMLRDPTVLPALTSTVLARGDREWAAALLAQGVDHPGLMDLLPDDLRRERLVAGLRAATVAPEIREALHREPRPWDVMLGRAVLRALGRPDADRLVPTLSRVLPTALPAELAPEVAEVLAGLEPDSKVRRLLSESLQIHAFRSSLTEAFR